jgi:hypothetical protein
MYLAFVHLAWRGPAPPLQARAQAGITAPGSDSKNPHGYGLAREILQMQMAIRIIVNHIGILIRILRPPVAADLLSTLGAAAQAQAVKPASVCPDGPTAD